MAIPAGTRRRRRASRATALAVAGIATMTGVSSFTTPASASTAPTSVSVLRAKLRAAHAKPNGPITTQSVPGPIAGCVGDKSMTGATTWDGVVQVFFTFVTDCKASDAAVTRVGGQVTGGYCWSGVSGSGCTQLPGWSPYYTDGKYATYSMVVTCYTGWLGNCHPTSVSAIHEILSFNQPYRWND